uniref:Uncharacterized protein n=1 Tax=Sinocyclocheilus anshuiensis TaxID=1608454 RepID=A0A671R507_9TELE
IVFYLCILYFTEFSMGMYLMERRRTVAVSTAPDFADPLSSGFCEFGKFSLTLNNMTIIIILYIFYIYCMSTFNIIKTLLRLQVYFKCQLLTLNVFSTLKFTPEEGDICTVYHTALKNNLEIKTWGEALLLCILFLIKGNNCK